MSKVIVKVKSADYYDTVQIFIDGIGYGKKKGNSIIEIPVAPGRHVIHGIYDNMEPEFKGYNHALEPIEFEVGSGDVHFTVAIINIFRGGKLTKD